MTGIAAVILAGGKAERLGGINKALIEIGGRTLLDRSRDVVAGCDSRLLAVGRSDFTADGITAVRDIESDYAGPLAGVAAAVEMLRDMEADWLLSLAVDTPFFPTDFAARALSLIGTADAAIGCFAGQDYPTNALWRLTSINVLPQGLRDGTAPDSLKRLAAGLKTVRLDYASTHAEDPFLNVNTPEDLAFLRGRAG